MFTPPSRAALPIFTDDDTKPNARATVAVLATLTQLQHAITQFVAFQCECQRINQIKIKSIKRASEIKGLGRATHCAAASLQNNAGLPQ